MCTRVRAWLCAQFTRTGFPMSHRRSQSTVTIDAHDRHTRHSNTSITHDAHTRRSHSALKTTHTRRVHMMPTHNAHTRDKLRASLPRSACESPQTRVTLQTQANPQQTTVGKFGTKTPFSSSAHVFLFVVCKFCFSIFLLIR